jgi:gluconate 2-dehydrogenase alpha chain
MGQQLCDSGLSVVALERGPWRDTSTDFATGFAQDELRYMWRHHLFQNVTDDTLTIRNNVNQEALPMRRLGSFLLGTGVGSGGVHWNGQFGVSCQPTFKPRAITRSATERNRSPITT